MAAMLSLPQCGKGIWHCAFSFQTQELAESVRPHLESWTFHVMDSLTRCVSKLQEDVKFLIYAVGYLDGLVQDCSNSIANALEVLQSCTKLLIYDWIATFMC